MAIQQIAALKEDGNVQGLSKLQAQGSSKPGSFTRDAPKLPEN